MTNRERLISLLGFAPESNSLEGEMLDFDITPADIYDPANSVTLKKAAIKIMELLLTTADTTNENQYAIKYDRVSVLARIKLLKGELGLVDESIPTITGKQVW
jgi:hypothetical protein